MECPHCSVKITDAPDVCPRCRFSLTTLTNALGCDLFGIKRLTDEAHCLKLHERREIEALLEDFEQRFPQVFLTLYLGVLPAPFSVRELAFLLLNRGAFATREHARLNEFALALVIDPVARHAALMTGYALERWLPPRKLSRLLRGVRTSLWHGEYVSAVRATVQRLEKRLRKAGQREARRHMLPPVAPGDFLAGSKFRPLRTPSAAEQSEVRHAKQPQDHPQPGWQLDEY